MLETIGVFVLLASIAITFLVFCGFIIINKELEKPGEIIATIFTALGVLILIIGQLLVLYELIYYFLDEEWWFIFYLVIGILVTSAVFVVALTIYAYKKEKEKAE